MKKFTLLILGLILCQSVPALLEPSFIDVEAFQQIAKDRPNTYARLQSLRAFSHRDVSDVPMMDMDSVTRSRYQELLAEEGPLTIELFLEKDAAIPGIRVVKATQNGSSLILFEAKDIRPVISGTQKFATQKQTPFAKFEPDATGWQLSIDDGRRNKLTAYISPTGNLTISSGQGMDTLEIKTSALLTFDGSLTFPRINLETNQVLNVGVLEVGTLSLRQFDKPDSYFTNAGYLQLADMRIDKSTFFNENKVISRKQLNLDLENSKFTNDKVNTKTGVVEAVAFNLTGTMGTFFNKGTLEVIAMKGTVHKLINEGTINIKSGEKEGKEAVHLEGQALHNKANWDAASGVDLQFNSIENSGNVTAFSLALQSDGTIKNHARATLYAKQIVINGKCYLTNKGTIFSEQQLNLKVSSTTNEGLLLAKDLLKIDNDGNYFNNTARGKIQTAGVLQIAATGPWWINAGEITANEVQSQGILFNIKSGNISSQRATLDGQLFNDATLTANELNAHMQSIGGEGKLLMTNGQIKIDGNHAQLGQWSCSGKCDWTAPKFSIFGSIFGNGSGQPAELTITSENGELWHGGDIYCAAGASCTTVSAGKTVNMPSSKIISNGSMKQQSINSDVSQGGSVIGGSYSAGAPKGSVNNRGSIDVDGCVLLESGYDVRNEQSIKGGSVTIDAGETLTNAPGAEVKSDKDTALKGKNIQQDGKVNTGGKFSSEAQKKFTNTNRIESEKGLKISAGEEIYNAEKATLFNKNGEMRLEAPKVINDGEILSKEDLKIFASKLFLNKGGVKGWNVEITGDTVSNVSGRILVGHLLAIHARKFENTRAPTIMKAGEYCPQPPRGGFGFWGMFEGLNFDLGFFGDKLGIPGVHRHSGPCQGDYEVETSDAAVISSMGDIVLDVGDGANIASMVYAKGDITITGAQFKNLAHNLKNYKVTKGWRHWETCRWWGLDCDDHYEPTTTVRNEPDYVGATLAADGKITVNGQNANNGQASGFENTGNVKAGKTFNLVSGDEFINGLFDSYTKTAKAPASKTGDFKIYEYLDSFGNLYYFRIADADEKVQFILIPASEADQKTLDQQVGAVTRGLSERPQIAYLQKETKESPLDHHFVMHPQLAAQVVESMLVMQLGTSHLSGFENKTAVEQYLALETRGYQYAQKFTDNTKEDALPLSSDQIASAGESFIYYDLVKYEGEVGYAPVLHIAKEEAQKHVPETEGTIQAGNIHIVTGDAKNTGALKSTGNLKITAHTFENRRRDYRETEIVKEQSGFWGGTRTRVFEIRTPEIGGNIIGLNIELTAEKDLTNEGGKIVGQKIYLVSEEGNVIHKAFKGKHMIRLHQSSWDMSHGRSSAEEVPDYYPAEIITVGAKAEEGPEDAGAGEIKVDAKIGKVLVQASDIIGTGNVNISGKDGVIINALLGKYKSYDSHTMLSGSSEETVVTLRSNVISTGGDVNIESAGGSIGISAATINALKGAVVLKAKDRINLGTQSIRYTKSKTEGADGFSIGSTKTTIDLSAVEQTIISAMKDVTIKAGEDNVLEAVLVYSGGAIHIVAGRDNYFKGFAKETNIMTEGWNVGISFPGSEALEALMKGNRGDSVKVLLDSDPLVAAMRRLNQARDPADKLGEGTYVAVEALRALDQYLKTSSQPGASMGGMVGQRMGLTDKDGKFAPKLTLRVGAFKSETHMTDFVKTALNAQGNVEITSGRNAIFSDGTIVNGDRIFITAKDITMTAAKNTKDSKSQSASASVSYGAGGWSGGASYSESEFNSVTNENVIFNAAKSIDFKATGDIYGSGVEARAPVIKAEAEGNIKLESVQDTAQGSSTSFSASTDGDSSSGSFSQESFSKARVGSPTGFFATESLDVNASGTLELVGGVLSGPADTTNIHARELKVTDLHDHEETISFGFKSQYSQNSDDPVSGVFDIDYKSESYNGKTLATISPDARIEVDKITEDLKNVNRELDKIQVGSTDETHFRAVVPLLNLEKIENDIHRLNELTNGNTKPIKPIEFSLQSDDSDDEAIVEYEDTAEEAQVKNDEPKESQKSTENKKSDKRAKIHDKKDALSVKLRVVSTESAVINGQEAEVTTVDLVDADGKSLGTVRIGDFEESPKNLQSQESNAPNSPSSQISSSFTNDQQEWIIKSDDGHHYVVRGDDKALEIIEEWRNVIADIGDNGLSLVPAVGPVLGAGFSQLVHWQHDPAKTLKGVGWGVADVFMVGSIEKVKNIEKLAAMAPKVVKLIQKTKQVIKDEKIASKFWPFAKKGVEKIKPDFVREITPKDLGIKGAVGDLRGRFSLKDGVAKVRINMIEAEIENPLSIINNLKKLAKDSGASTLRIEGTIAYPRLLEVLSKRYKMVTEGGTEFIELILK